MGQHTRVDLGRLMKSQPQETLLKYLAIKAFPRSLGGPPGFSLKRDPQIGKVRFAPQLYRRTQEDGAGVDTQEEVPPFNKEIYFM